MNTNMTGFRCFSEIFASLCFGQKGLDVFQRSLHPYALDKSSLSIERVNIAFMQHPLDLTLTLLVATLANTK